MTSSGYTDVAYSVAVEFEGEIRPERVDTVMEDVLDGLLERTVGPVVSGDAGGIETRFTLVYDVPREFVDVAGEALGIAREALQAARSGHLDVEAVSVETDGHLERRLAQPGAELVGLSEIAGILDVSKQRVSQLRERPDFPKPVEVLASGPVWHRGMLDRFIAEWERRPGRPLKWDLDPSEAGRLLAEARSLLTARELEILERLSAGASAHEIAAELGVTDEGTRSVIRRMMSKLQEDFAATEQSTR